MKRLGGLFERYALANAEFECRPRSLKDRNGTEIGRLEQLRFGDDRIRVSGYLQASRVVLHCENDRAVAQRPANLPSPTPLRFNLSVPRAIGAHEVRLSWDGETASLRLPGPYRTKAYQVFGFSQALLKALPALIGWARTKDPRHRGQVKRLLGLDGTAHFGPLKTGDLPAGANSRQNPPGRETVTILLPVHNGFDLLEECLERVRNHTDLSWRLVLIEDGSTDARVRPYLRSWTEKARSAGHEIRLIEPHANLGFVGAVNAGLEALLPDPELTSAENAGPVVLLNSDALVPEGWASRLVSPLADPDVASVTPMSNDSEITSLPIICGRSDLRAGAADRIDAVARRYDPLSATAEMPTGVGFCMALSPRYLARVPRLDTAFGRGYGEEVDWCRKTAALGGKHLGTAALFVEHRGGASFGSEAKRLLVANNNAIISSRYPTYDLEVQRFIQADPLRGPRLALTLAWAATMAEEVPLYLAHSLGGGAEIWLERQIATGLAKGQPSAVLRVGGAMRWQLEVHSAAGTTGGSTDDETLILGLLDLLPRRRVIYSCGVGDPDPVTLPDFLLRLQRPGDDLEILLHDWLPISPSYTLLDADGVYRGPVTADRNDPAHVARRPDGRQVALKEWQGSWGRLMHAANRVRIFSEDGRRQIEAAWPALDPARIEVRGHAVPEMDRLAMPDGERSPDTRPIIGVIGNLNRHKGAEVVAALGRQVGSLAGPAGMVVLGRIDPACVMPGAVSVHGGYRINEIPDLARSYGITHWLVPAVWPETFSYATHEALATGLPVLAFDIGAQGAAVRSASNGYSLPYPEDGNAGSAAKAVVDALQKETRHED